MTTSRLMDAIRAKVKVGDVTVTSTVTEYDWGDGRKTNARYSVWVKLPGMASGETWSGTDLAALAAKVKAGVAELSKQF